MLQNVPNYHVAPICRTGEVRMCAVFFPVHSSELLITIGPFCETLPCLSHLPSCPSWGIPCGAPGDSKVDSRFDDYDFHAENIPQKMAVSLEQDDDAQRRTAHFANRWCLFSA